MKIYCVIIVAAVCLVSGTVMSQPKAALTEQRLAYAQKNMIVGLRSGNTGVVESTMMLVAKVKLYCPARDVDGLLKIVDSLSVAGHSASLRYKAYVISNICADPLWFAHEPSLQSLDPDRFYVDAAQRLQQKMLGISSL